MNNTEHISAHIEALLFVLGRPVSKQELTKKLEVPAEDIAAALLLLSSRLTGGLALVDDGVQVELRTAPATSQYIEQIQKEEYSRDIGRAGLEALAAILYRGPLTRAEVDFIRGVNSTQTLRTLTMRGLVRKIQNPKDGARPTTGRQGSFLYEPTTELLAMLGIHTKSELPEYAETRTKLEQLEAAYRQEEGSSSHT